MTRSSRTQSDPKPPITEPDDGSEPIPDDDTPEPTTEDEPEPAAAETLPHIPPQIDNPPYEPPPLPETSTAGTDPEPPKSDER